MRSVSRITASIRARLRVAMCTSPNETIFIANAACAYHSAPPEMLLIGSRERSGGLKMLIAVRILLFLRRRRGCQSVVARTQQFMGALDHFAFVLVSPKSSGNVGAAARALKNMGFGDLRMVAPRDYDPRGGGRDGGACGRCPRARAHLSRLDGGAPRSHANGRHHLPHRPVSQRDARARTAATALIAEGAANRIAMVFGPEDFGLSNDEIAQCQRLITIPTAPDYPSLNLAQAVMVVAYELMIAAGAERAPIEVEEFAPAVAVEEMHRRMADALVEIGFLPATIPTISCSRCAQCSAVAASGRANWIFSTASRARFDGSPARAPRRSRPSAHRGANCAEQATDILMRRTAVLRASVVAQG